MVNYIFLSSSLPFRPALVKVHQVRCFKRSVRPKVLCHRLPLMMLIWHRCFRSGIPEHTLHPSRLSSGCLALRWEKSPIPGVSISGMVMPLVARVAWFRMAPCWYCSRCCKIVQADIWTVPGAVSVRRRVSLWWSEQLLPTAKLECNS